MRKDEIQFVVQVDGRKKGLLKVVPDLSATKVEEMAFQIAGLRIEDRVLRIVHIPEKLINFVTK